MVDAKITLVMPRLPYVVLRCLLKKTYTCVRYGSKKLKVFCSFNGLTIKKEYVVSSVVLKG